MTTFRRRPGLPPYGPMATSFPAEWGKRGREGLVVEFLDDDGSSWTGNFHRGRCGSRVNDVLWHPNWRQVLVIAAGELWCVTTENQTAKLLSGGVFGVWTVQDPDGFVFNTWNIYFVRLGPDGVLWHTRRISMEGFDKVRIEAGALVGETLEPDSSSGRPFSVDLKTGQVEGGSYFGREMDAPAFDEC